MRVWHRAAVIGAVVALRGVVACGTCHDTRGDENADERAFTSGAPYALPNGSLANLRLGGRDFLVQRKGVNAASGYYAIGFSRLPATGRSGSR